MADEILFMDGFEHYADDDIFKKYDGFQVSDIYFNANVTTSPRFTAASTANAYMTVTPNNGSNGSHLTKTIITTDDTVTIGMALRVESATGGFDEDFAHLGVASDNNYYRIILNGSGEIKVLAGGTTVTTTTTFGMSNAVWTFVEVEIKQSTSGTGYVKVYKNGTLNHTFNGITDIDAHAEDFAQAGVCYNFRPTLVGGHGLSEYDDLYIKNDTFLGDVRVITLIPNAAGAFTDFTPLSGSNHSNVDEIDDIDEDSSYVENGSVGARELYNIDTFTSTPTTIHGVQLNVVSKKTDATERKYVPMLYVSATQYDGTEITLDSSYKDNLEVWNQNPNTSTAWTVSDIGSLQIGFRVTA